MSDEWEIIDSADTELERMESNMENMKMGESIMEVCYSFFSWNFTTLNFDIQFRRHLGHIRSQKMLKRMKTLPQIEEKRMRRRRMYWRVRIMTFCVSWKSWKNWSNPRNLTWLRWKRKKENIKKIMVYWGWWW